MPVSVYPVFKILHARHLCAISRIDRPAGFSWLFHGRRAGRVVSGEKSKWLKKSAICEKIGQNGEKAP